MYKTFVNNRYSKFVCRYLRLLKIFLIFFLKNYNSDFNLHSSTKLKMLFSTVIFFIKENFFSSNGNRKTENTAHADEKN